MEMNYTDALEQIRSMFSGFDEDTIKSVLAANDGHLERTIEDLLKMTAEAERRPRGHDDDDDNLFADPQPINRGHNRNEELFGIDDEGNRIEDLGIFQQDNGSNYQDDRIAREMQEKADAEIAFQLQKQYIERQENREHEYRQQVRASQQESQQRNTQSRGHTSESHNRPSSNQGYNQAGHMQNQNQNQSPKKKTGFISKMKAGINNLFGKKSKKQQPLAGNPTAQYAEIDNLEEHEVYNFNNANAIQSRNDGIHQLNNYNNHNEQNDDAPMQLADVLGSRGGHESDEENNVNPYYNHNQNNYNNQGDYNNQNRGGMVSNDHFRF